MPSGNRDRGRRASALAAFCGMTAALSVVLMLAGGLIPIATYVSPLLASALLLPVCVEFTRRAAWGTWLVTAVVALLLGMDKEAAFLYLFVGWWPAAKTPLEARIRGRMPRLLLKAALFAICVGAMYSLLIFLMHMEAIEADFGEMGQWMTGLFFVALVACLLLFDRLLTPLGVIYERRIRPKLRFLRR